MKRKFLVLLAIAMIVATALSACDIAGGKNNGGEEECEHTFSEAWSTNSTDHWHAATCEHNDQKSNAAKHTDADEDGKCDVCAYNVGHVHTFGADWVKDATHHWLAPLCSHTDIKGDYALHVDANANGECDVCAAALSIQIDPNDVAAVIDALYERAAAVNGGRIVYSNICTSAVDYSTSEINEIIDFVFGNGNAYYKTSTLSHTGTEYTVVSVMEKWYEQVGAGEYFGATRVDDDPIYLDPGATAETLIGYNFFISTLTTASGTETALYTLYSISQGAGSSNYVFEYDEIARTYTFSFDCIVINDNVAEGTAADAYTVSVSFAHNANYVLTDLTIVCNCYTDSCEEEADKDFIFNPTDGTIQMKPGAIPDTYTFTVTQTAGERTYVNEHGKESFIPKDFSLYKDEARTEKIDGTLNVYADEVSYVYLGAFIPEFSAASYLPNDFTVSFNGTTNYYASSLPISNALLFNVKSIGQYQLVINVGSVTKKLIVNVTQRPSTPVVEQPENTVAVTITDPYAWISLATFTADADGDYTFIIAPGLTLSACDKNIVDSEFANGTAPWADFQVSDLFTGENCLGGERTVSLRKGESYYFYVYSDTKGTYFIPYTVSEYTGEAVAGIDNSKINGIWQYAVGGTTYLEFIFEDGIITTTDFTGSLGLDETYTYTFNTNNNVITVNGSDTAMFTYDGSVIYISASFGEGALVKAPYRYNLVMGDNPVNGEDANFSFTSDAKGTLTLIVGSAANGDVTLTYSVNDGNKISIALGGITDIALNEGDKLVIYAVATGYTSFDASFTVAGADVVIPDGAIDLPMGPTNIDPSSVTFSYVATADGTLTLKTVSVVNGEAEFYYSINGGTYVSLAINTTIQLVLDEGDTVIIKATSTGYTAISATFEEKGFEIGSEKNPYVIDGTGTFDISAVYGDYVYVKTTVGGLTLTLNCSAQFYDADKNALGKTVVTVAGGIYLVSADYVAGCTGTITANTQANEDGSYPIIMGNNTIPAENVTFKYTATAEGKLKLTLGDAFGGAVELYYSVNGGSELPIYTGSSASINIYAGDMIVIRVASEGTSTLTVSFSEEDLPDLPTEDNIKDISTVNGSGTSSDPYVITDSSYYQTGAVNAYPGLYFSITAKTDITVTIYNDIPNVYNNDYSQVWAESNGSCVKHVAAGETLIFILCMDRGTVSSSLIGIFIEEDDGSGSGDEISGTPYTSTDGALTVYVGSDTVTFVLDSDKLGYHQSTYSYEVDGTDVILYDNDGNVVDQREAQLSLNAQGVPTSAVYYDPAYTYRF